jgi:metal-responsive CopG/Arc/MetJ family transcriptional regulator
MANSNVRKVTLDTRYGIRLQARLVPAIQAAAEKQFMTTSEFIRRAIVTALKTEDANSPATRKRAA